MLYRHSKDLVIRLPLDSRSMEAIARSLLESPLTFKRWQDTFDSAEKMQWSPGRGPIHYWLLTALGVRPSITPSTVEIAGIHIPTPEWVQRAIAADPETYPLHSELFADVDDQFILTSIDNKKSFISQVNPQLGN